MQQLAIKKKIRMNSEEKLMAKKVEQANANKFAKNNQNKYVRLGSGNERKKQSTLKKNTSQYMTSSASGFTNKDKDKSSEKYAKYLQAKKLSIKGSKKRVGSPAHENEK